MNNLIEFTRPDEALLGWASWLGRSVSDLSQSLSVKIREAAPSIARFLNNAPDENAQGGPFYEVPLDDLFHSFGKRQGVHPSAFWPEERPYAVCITHDVSRAFSTDRLIRLQAELGYRSSVYVPFEKRRWLTAIKERDWEHAFGVFNPAAIAEDLKAFAECGNEVGVQSSLDSYCRDNLLSKERLKLKEWGITAHGVRSRRLKFDPVLSSRATGLAGFRYDTSLGFNFSNGFRMGTCFPFFRHGVWELPLQLTDSALRYQFATISERRRCVTEIQRTVRRVGGVLILNWPTHVMNTQNRSDAVELIAQVVQTAQRDGAWLARPVDVIRRWEERTYPSNQAISQSCENSDAAVNY